MKLFSFHKTVTPHPPMFLKSARSNVKANLWNPVCSSDSVLQSVYYLDTEPSNFPAFLNEINALHKDLWTAAPSGSGS